MGWGSRWRKMLNTASDQERVRRGWEYERKGAVRDLRIANGQGVAKVYGSEVYTVRFKVPQFTSAEKDRLVQYILSTPRLLDLLERRIFDDYWERFLSKTGFVLFPRNCEALGFVCDCPHSASVCKHIAAVVVHMSLLLDEDPFLLFQWQGLDLLEALSKAGMSTMAEVPLPELQRIEDLLQSTCEGSSLVPACDLRLDYDRIPDAGDALTALLPKQPIFITERDFRASYVNAMRNVHRFASMMLRNLEAGRPLRNRLCSPIPKEAEVRLGVDSSLRIGAYVLVDGEDSYYSASNFIYGLENIRPEEVAEYHPSVQWLWQAYVYVLHLAEKKMLQCQWVMLPEDCYGAIWEPSPLSPEVVALRDSFESSFPMGILYVRDKKSAVLDPGRWVFCVLLKLLMDPMNIGINHPIDRVFFHNVRVRAGKGHERIPLQIQAWLDHQRPSSGKYQPMVVVDECQYGFMFSIQLVDLDAPGAQPVELDAFMSDPAYTKDRLSVYGLLRSLMYISRAFINLIESRGKSVMVVQEDQMIDMLDHVFPLLQVIGFQVLLPKSIEHMLLPNVVAKMKQKGSSLEMLHLEDLLDFRVDVILDKHQVSLANFLKMVEKADGLIRYKGQYFRFDQALIERMQGLYEKQRNLSALDKLALAVDGDYEGIPVALSEEVNETIGRLSRIDSVMLPDGLQAVLRPYQVRGYEWLYKNAQCGLGSILADDMGLGKTLQVITFLLKVKEEQGGRFLVIAPTGLLTNWRYEVERFAPTLSVFVYYGDKRDLSGYEQDILLTSYATARLDRAELSKIDWEVVVVDEAQNIKNSKTAQAKAVMGFSAKCRIAMSGTPVENRLTELWSIMQFTNPGLLGSLTAFTKRFVTPIQKEGDVELSQRLKRMTAPFVMRRLKSDHSIISDLPDKVERNEYVSLVPEQAALYRSTLNKAMRVIEDFPEEGDHRTLFKRKGLVLQMILALKQICNHPSQYLKAKDADAKQSGKLSMLLDMVDHIVAADEKVLVFTQYREMGELLVQAITSRIGREPLFYHGGLSTTHREELVRRFQEVPEDSVFVVTLKAAGTGLNLTAASHVIHYDLWWNPAVESQATDRAYRIGQHKNVQVHRFITEGTFEERIDQMIAKKRSLAEMTVSTGEQWIGDLSNKELRALFS